MRKTIFISFLTLFIVSCDLKTAEKYTSEAKTLTENKDYKGAINLLNKAIKQDDKYLDAYINRGANKAELNDNINAVDDFKKVLLIDPNNTLALFNIGKIYCNLKKI